MKKTNVAILGFGVVGSGVYKVINENKKLIETRLEKLTNRKQTVNIKRILVKDIGKYDGNLQSIMTEDIEEILEDESITIVCELIGGNGTSVNYIKKSIDSGKHIVTANKMAIFTKYEELIDYSKSKGVRIKYEASVAGSVPIIKVVEESLIGDEIYEVSGILNGSTNYISTKISEGLSYDEAFSLANEKGYLEADPSLDISGYDSMYKLGILGNLIYGEFPKEEDINRAGIDSIEAKDINLAKEKGEKIKLVGRIINEDGNIKYSVKPEFVDDNNPLFRVDGSSNGILLKCRNAGEIFLSGPGAGSEETAVSVVADILSIISSEENVRSRNKH